MQPRRKRNIGWACPLVFVFSVFLALPAIASPWGQTRGDLFTVTRADYFVGVGEMDRFQRFESNIFAEFGLSDQTTIGGKVLYGTSQFETPSRRISDSGISEIEGFVQRKVAGGELNVLALRLSAARPAEFGSGARLGVINDGAEVELRALAGRTLAFKNVKLFATSEIGYRKRFGSGADQFRADATIGYEPTQHWLVLLDVFSILSARNEASGGSDFDVLKVQPSLIRKYRRWGLQIGATHEITGRNLLRGTTYFIGLWTAF